MSACKEFTLRAIKHIYLKCWAANDADREELRKDSVSTDGGGWRLLLKTKHAFQQSERKIRSIELWSKTDSKQTKMNEFGARMGKNEKKAHVCKGPWRPWMLDIDPISILWSSKLNLLENSTDRIKVKMVILKWIIQWVAWGCCVGGRDNK